MNVEEPVDAPRCAESMTDNENKEPNRAMPNTLNDDPNRAKERSAMDDPKCEKSMTLQ